MSSSDTSITIKWEPVYCSDRNGKIVGYNVTYFSTLDVEKSERITVSGHTFTAVGLLFKREYTLEVQALSREHGSGPAANIKIHTTALRGKNITIIMMIDNV